MNQDILHFGGIKVRVQGSGTLQPSLFSMDGNNQFTPNSITMTNPAEFEPFRLTNLITQRCKIRLETEALNDYMEVYRIVLFYKQIFSQLPG